MGLLAGLAAGAALLGSILSGIGRARESRAQERMARANKARAEEEAGQIEEAYKWKVSDLQTEQARFMGRQRSVIGSANVELSSGSPRALMTETARMAGEDVRRLTQAGEWEKEARLFEASQYGKEAEEYKKIRRWQIGGSLLGSVASGFGMFL